MYVLTFYICAHIYIYIYIYISGGTTGKEPAYQCRRYKRCGFNPWFENIPWRRAWLPTPVFLLGETHRQRRMAGSGPWGWKELDMTEETTCLHIYIYKHHSSQDIKYFHHSRKFLCAPFQSILISFLCLLCQRQPFFTIIGFPFSKTLYKQSYR